MFRKKNSDMYSEIFDLVNKNVDSFSDEIGKIESEDELMKLLVNMIIPIARNGFLTEERKLRLFYECEKLGVHILPTHFYYPIPNTSELPNALWEDGISDMPVNFNYAECEVLVNELQPYMSELANISKNGHEGTFYWNNPAIGPCDASIYYAMIRKFKPKKVIEIGSGYSTLLAVEAVKRNEGRTTFESIEPYPFE